MYVYCTFSNNICNHNVNLMMNDLLTAQEVHTFSSNNVCNHMFLSPRSELITSVSERCSGIIVEGNALPVLFHFMRTSNRSRPTLEVMKTCLQILNNVAKVCALLIGMYFVYLKKNKAQPEH